MSNELKDIIKKVLQAGVNGRHFQFRDIREALGINPEERNLAGNTWNRFISLERDGLIDEIGTRTRNKYYRVRDEAKLRERLNVYAPPAPIPFKLYGRSSTALQPPARLEHELHKLRGETERLREEIRQQLAEHNAKIDQLVRLWS